MWWNADTCALEAYTRNGVKVQILSSVFMYELNEFSFSKRNQWLRSLPDGTPCDHPGCLSHVKCKVCERIAGIRKERELFDWDNIVEVKFFGEE